MYIEIIKRLYKVKKQGEILNTPKTYEMQLIQRMINNNRDKESLGQEIEYLMEKIKRKHCKI